MVADVVLVLDESTSIVNDPSSYDNWLIYVLGFSMRLVQAFSISPSMTRFGILKFSDNATIAIYLDRYTDVASLTDAIGKLDIDGGETNMAAALRVTRCESFLPVFFAL